MIDAIRKWVCGTFLDHHLHINYTDNCKPPCTFVRCWCGLTNKTLTVYGKKL